MDSYDPLAKWWWVITWQIKSITYPFWQDRWLQNLASWWLIVRWRIVTYRWLIVDGPIKSHVLLITWFHKVTWQTENDSSSRRLVATKICRVLTVMKLHKFDHMTTRGQVTNWKLNNSSSTRSIPQHSAEWWRRTLWPCSLVRSQQKFKTKI